MTFYHYFSLGKIALGISILISLYILINPFTDPLVALSGAMIGLFLLARGGSFFVFLGRQKYIRRHQLEEELTIYSYKLSLLFGIYILFNVIFLFKNSWTIAGGIVLLIVFIIIQYLILPPLNHHHS